MILNESALELKTIEDYLTKNYPSVADEYARYLKSEQLPEIGDKIVTLRRGFGGEAGRFLKITEIDAIGITLTDGDREYFSCIETWYKDIEKVN